MLLLVVSFSTISFSSIYPFLLSLFPPFPLSFCPSFALLLSFSPPIVQAQHRAPLSGRQEVSAETEGNRLTENFIIECVGSADSMLLLSSVMIYIIYLCLDPHTTSYPSLIIFIYP